jgi:prefoldin subunit 5
MTSFINTAYELQQLENNIVNLKSSIAYLTDRISRLEMDKMELKKENKKLEKDNDHKCTLRDVRDNEP